MSDTKTQEIKILHVDMKFEADSIINTLKEHGIPAYCSETPDTNPLGLPGAIGINETGYDITILESDRANAAEILAGIGYVVSDDDDAVHTCDEPVDAETPERELTDEEKRQRLQQSIDELSPAKRVWYTICIAAFVLIGLTLFVVLCDLFVAFIKSLFIG